MRLVEDAGFFLAKDIVMDKNPVHNAPSSAVKFDVNWVEPQVSLGIHVQRATENIPGSTAILWSTSRGDTVELDVKAIDEAMDNKSNKTLVFVSFANIGKYLQDSAGLGSIEKPVNSEVVSVSVASATDGKFTRISHSLELKRPLLLHLRHYQKYLLHHECAFWDNRQR